MKFNPVYFDFIRGCQERGERFMIFQGGRRAGKTIAILQDIFRDLADTDLRKKQKGRALIVTDTYSRLEGSIREDYHLIDPYNQWSRWNGAPRIDFMQTHNTIKFAYEGKSTLGTTSNLTHLFFNECCNYDESVVRNLLYAAGDNCKIYFDYNPYTRFWLNDKYETDTNKLITTWRDNAFIPAGAKQALLDTEMQGKDAKPGTLERYLYEVECLGLDASLSGLCFPNSEVITESEYDDCPCPEVLASDWGQILSTADPDVVCGFKFDGNRILCREYYYRNDGSDSDIVEVLKSIPFSSQYFVFETATAGKARIENIYNLSGLRFKYVPCTKGVGSVMIGIRNLQQYQICITAGSFNFRQEQKNYKYVTKSDILMPADRNNHAFDCLRYAFDFYSGNKSKL